MTLSRRSLLGALAGLPVLGRVLQRAPLPDDLQTVTNGFSALEQDQRAHPMMTLTVTPNTSGTMQFYTRTDASGSWTYTY